MHQQNATQADRQTLVFFPMFLPLDALIGTISPCSFPKIFWLVLTWVFIKVLYLDHVIFIFLKCDVTFPSSYKDKICMLMCVSLGMLWLLLTFHGLVIDWALISLFIWIIYFSCFYFLWLRRRVQLIIKRQTGVQPQRWMGVMTMTKQHITTTWTIFNHGWKFCLHRFVFWAGLGAHENRMSLQMQPTTRPTHIYIYIYIYFSAFIESLNTENVKKWLISMLIAGKSDKTHVNSSKPNVC